MLLTWMNRWVCRLELEMIGWSLGVGRGTRDRLPENEDDDLDIEPDREWKEIDERLVDTVWLRVKRWARDHQSLPDVFKEEKEDHLFFF